MSKIPDSFETIENSSKNLEQLKEVTPEYRESLYTNRRKISLVKDFEKRSSIFQLFQKPQSDSFKTLNDLIDRSRLLSSKNSFQLNKRRTIVQDPWPFVKHKRDKKYKVIFIMKLKDDSNKTILPLKDKPNIKIRFNEFLEGIVIDNGMDGWTDNPRLFRYYRNGDYNNIERCIIFSLLSCLLCCQHVSKDEIANNLAKKEKYYMVHNKTKLTLIDFPCKTNSFNRLTKWELAASPESSYCVETIENSESTNKTGSSLKSYLVMKEFEKNPKL